jgi:hypothetical protein
MHSPFVKLTLCPPHCVYVTELAYYGRFRNKGNDPLIALERITENNTGTKVGNGATGRAERPTGGMVNSKWDWGQ